MSFERFDHYVQQHSEELIQQLAALCRIPSVSAERGPAMQQAAKAVAELCSQAGLSVQTIDHPDGGPPLLIAQGGAGPRCLMIYNHYDVQPADQPTLWHTPPFELTQVDDQLYARGAADNKADLVARLSALAIYQQTVGPLPVRILYVIEGEEETGSQHLFSFSRANRALLAQADGCLWEYGEKDEAGRPRISLGVKGILEVELRARSANSDAHSAYGGLMPNAAWRLTEALHSLRAADGSVQIDGLADHIEAPNAEQLAMLADIPFTAATMTQTYALRHGLLGELDGEAALRRLLFEPSLSINGLWGGYTGPGSKTVIPAQATAKLDLRLVPHLSPDLALDLLRQHLQRRGFDDIEVAYQEDGLMPARTAPHEAIAQAAVQAVAAVSAGTPLVYPSSAGSGPMYELCGIHGIPTASFGVAWANSKVHAPNENIRLADYVEGVRVMGRMIAAFAEKL
ncbi:MAG: M20/M25/M40 family metallo-hydrolase [Caldilineales bacterium]